MDWWKRLDPKQRKIVMAAGGGVVLAVVLMAARGRQADPTGAVDPTATGTPPPGVDPFSSVAPDTGVSSFADNGAGFGQLSTAISDSIGGVSTSLDSVSSAITDQGERLSAVEAAAASAVAAANQAAKAAAQKPPGTPRDQPSKLLRDARRRDVNPHRPGLQLDPRDTNPHKPGLQRNRRDKDPTRVGIQKLTPKQRRARNRRKK